MESAYPQFGGGNNTRHTKKRIQFSDRGSAISLHPNFQAFHHGQNCEENVTNHVYTKIRIHFISAYEPFNYLIQTSLRGKYVNPKVCAKLGNVKMDKIVHRGCCWYSKKITMRNSLPSDHAITHRRILNIFYVTKLPNFVTSIQRIDTVLFSNHSRNDLKDTADEEFFRKMNITNQS